MIPPEKMQEVGNHLVPEGGLLECVIVVVSFIGPDGEYYTHTVVEPSTRFSSVLGLLALAADELTRENRA
jgi:hypothetical protein